MTSINQNPDAKQLRQFGIVSAAIVMFLFGLLIPWLFNRHIPSWPWVLAAILGAWGLVLPKTLIVVYKPWLKFGAMMGFIKTHILLGVVFYLLITPVGWVIRLFGNNLLEKSSPASDSHRVQSAKPDNKHMEKPY